MLTKHSIYLLDVKVVFRSKKKMVIQLYSKEPISQEHFPVVFVLADMLK